MKTYSLPDQHKLSVRLGITGFWIRALARLIDHVLQEVVTLMAIGIMLAIVVFISKRGDISTATLHKLEDLPLPFLLFWSMLGAVLWNGLVEGVSGTSIGKAVLGLSVVRLDGTRCSFLQGVKRNLAYPFDAILFGSVAYFTMNRTPLNQRIGDTFANTVVVSRFKNKNIGRIPWARLLFGQLAAITGAMLYAVVRILIGVLLRT